MTESSSWSGSRHSDDAYITLLHITHYRRRRHVAEMANRTLAEQSSDQNASDVHHFAVVHFTVERVGPATTSGAFRANGLVTSPGNPLRPICPTIMCGSRVAKQLAWAHQAYGKQAFRRHGSLSYVSFCTSRSLHHLHNHRAGLGGVFIHRDRHFCISTALEL